MDRELEQEQAGWLKMVGRSWGWALFFGILTLIIGIVVVTYPGHALGVVAVLFALELFLVGLFRLGMAFAGSEKHRVLSAVLGVLAIIAAIICLRNIAQTLVIVGLLLGIYWVVYGVIDLVMATGDKAYPNRTMAIVTSILSAIAGIIVLSYPIGSELALAMFLGVWFILLGLLGIFGALSMRSGTR
jgi:uncharacterized membrane protein HdeD (DUF308 family)